jgi:hypothetical protein
MYVVRMLRVGLRAEMSILEGECVCVFVCVCSIQVTSLQLCMLCVCMYV